MSSTNQTNKFTRFLRNNAALLLLVFCVVAISAVVIAVSVTGDDPNTPVGGNPNDPIGGNPSDTPVDETPKPVIVKEKIYFPPQLPTKVLACSTPMTNCCLCSIQL